jgi:ferritin-like metal-binding protein YciE
MSRTPKEQLVHFLSDMYSVEQQALAQLISAPDSAGDPMIAADFRRHHAETEEQAELVCERLEANGGSPSAVKDALMKLGGKGFLLFARVQPETPGRLLDHAYSYEAMEWAGYQMLEGFAAHVGDQQTVLAARKIAAEEQAMMERLAAGFDAAEAVSHGTLGPDMVAEHLRRHLTEVHAFESQGIQLLKKSQSIAGNTTLSAIYANALATTQEHAKAVEQRLQSLSADTSSIKDDALALGGINWGLFFQAQSDTAAKLAAFVYAVQHLDIGGYELLKRTARRIEDAETAQLCERIIADKRTIADRLSNAFQSAVQATLDALAE